MPWNYRDCLHIGLLICCIPLQFYFSNYKGNTGSSNNDNAVFKLISDIRNIKESLFSITSWKNSWMNFLSWFVIDVLGVQREVSEAIDESPAIEVLEYRKKHGLRGKSSIIHTTRPPDLWFRVGQVVEHIYGGYKGVIIEWEFDPKKSNMPLYTLLVHEDTTDETDFTGIVDVDQDQLYLLKNTQIVNRFLKNYFSTYDGAQYIPQPWLQQLYPKD